MTTRKGPDRVAILNADGTFDDPKVYEKLGEHFGELSEETIQDVEDLKTLTEEGRLSEPSLNATYVAFGTAHALREKCRLGQSANIGIAGDSTSNKPDEWTVLGLTEWAKDYPRQSVDYYEWDGTSAYGAVIPMRTGIVARSVIFRDEFDRSAADIIGSTPTIPYGSNVYANNGNGTGDWSLDGADCVATADASRGQVLHPVPAGDIELTVTALVPASQTARFYIKWVDASNNLSVYIAKNSSGGQYRLQLVKTIAGSGATIISSAYFFVNPQIPEEDLTMTARVVGSRFTAEVNGVCVGAILSGGDVTALSTANKVGIWGTAVTGVKLRRLEVAAITAANAGTIAIYNGSKDSTDLSYQAGLVASLYPTGTPLDLLIVNSGHNYGNASPATYQAAIDSFVTAFRTQQATAPITIATQNPRIASATYQSEQGARAAALPAYCATEGYGCMDTFAALTKQPVGLNYIHADGVHPTGGLTGGSGVMADAAIAWLRTA